MTDAPVRSWAEDYDIFDHGYIVDPYSVWDDLRSDCPIARSERWGGSWLPTRYEDVVAMARDIEHFSSRNVGVVPPPENDEYVLPAGLPPIGVDPPVHTWTRRLLLPWFSHGRVESYEPMTRELCRRLIGGFIEHGRADAAGDYAQQIPVRVIAQILGVPTEMSDTFTGWVRDVLEYAHDEDRRLRGRRGVFEFFVGALAERKVNPDGDDLISELLRAEVDGQKVPDQVVMGMAALLLIAGIDTTWSGIGSALYHLATHPEDRDRLVAEPELIPTAVEELLRAYSPVTMGRIVTQDLEYQGCPMKEGDRVLLSFPAANRDPAAFPDADKVIIDREENRHVAFGVGIHRCAGSNLARMEMRVAVEEWLARIPRFSVVPDAEVTWAGGQVRGPRELPVEF
jgi:hypothetical protein